MSQIFIELDGDGRDDVREQTKHLHDVLTIVETSRFDGVLVLQVLAMLNTVTIPILAKLVTERIRSNRHVIVKKNGKSVSVSGLNADDIVKVFSAMSKDD